MKTIFLTITNGTVARNILRTGVLKNLLAEEQNRIVLLIPDKVEDYFMKEFSHERVIFERISDIKNSRLRKLVTIIFNGLTYTETERRMLKFGGGDKGPQSTPMYYLKHGTFSIISRIKFLKYIARWIEQYVFIEKDFDSLFKKHNPDVVFCSTMYAKPDVIFIKAAKRFGVFCLSMPKSWDTVGRLFFRAPSDIIIVNNKFMKDWIVNEQGLPAESIYICGIPQFDIHENKKNFLSKDEFCKETGLDSSKPNILFASEGKWIWWDWAYIEELIEKYRILDRYNLILRPHFSNLEEKLYDRFRSYKGIYVDDSHIRITKSFGDRWDPTKENMEWFTQVLHSTDAVIAFNSTVVLDAFAMNKPVVNLYYDLPVEGETIPQKELYDCVHYNAVKKFHAVPEAYNGAEIIEWLDKSVADPNIFIKERKQVLDYICHKVDGRSAERISRIILAAVHKDLDEIRDLL